MNMLLNALGYVGSSLDKPGAAVRGLLGGQGAGALANLVPFSDAASLTDESDRMSGRGLLEHYGWVKPKEEGEGFDFGDALGMGAEFLTDPLTWAGGLGLGKAARVNRLAESNNTLRAKGLVHNQGVGELLKGGAMPEEVANATRAVDEAGRPVATFHGTSSAFDKYDLSKMDPEALYGPGIYTTVDPNVASEYVSKGARETMDLSDPAGLRQAAQQMMGHLPAINEKELAELNQYGVRGGALNSAKASQADRAQVLEAMMAGDLDAANRIASKYGDGLDAFRHFDEFKPYVVPSPGNVRKQFLDVRNPFDIDRQFGSQEASQLLSTLDPETTFFPKAKGQQLYDLIEQYKGGRPQANEFLRSQGYDGITHVGGGRVGDVAHQVYIAFDPKQVYHPMVAPALKQVPEFMAGRRYSPLLAALGTDQGLSRSRDLYQGGPPPVPPPPV